MGSDDKQAALIDHFWAVVPAGGSGTRLWPVSRAASPKFLHDLTGTGNSLLQATIARLESLVGERMLVVTGAAHLAAAREQVPQLPSSSFVAEPSPRDSMAAIGLAAALLELRDPEAIIGSFAADHVIADQQAFEVAVGEAIQVAARDYLVTIGIAPTYPATGFGYIQTGPRLTSFPTAARVRQFVEKPDEQRAASYLATGEFRWNAGMFVVRARVLLDLLQMWHSQLAQALRALAQRLHDGAELADLEASWEALEKIAIDHAVAEPAADIGRVAVVPGTFAWDDVGDFRSLLGLLPTTDSPVTVVGNDDLVCQVDSTGLVVSESGRMITLVGVANVVVVETPDALLVTTREAAQDVKLIVQQLKDAGRADLL